MFSSDLTGYAPFGGVFKAAACGCCVAAYLGTGILIVVEEIVKHLRHPASADYKARAVERIQL